MGKISFSNLKLKLNKTVKTFSFDGKEIEVLNYLPIEQKNELIMITLQQSEEDGIYNRHKLELFFNINLVYMYTNLSFTEKQKEDPFKLYDILNSSGFIDKFLECLIENSNEYYNLKTCLDLTMSNILCYKNTAGAVIQSFIQDLPKSAEAASMIVENFDKEKFQAVIDFANAANGNKAIE